MSYLMTCRELSWHMADILRAEDACEGQMAFLKSSPKPDRDQISIEANLAIGCSCVAASQLQVGQYLPMPATSVPQRVGYGSAGTQTSARSLWRPLSNLLKQ